MRVLILPTKMRLNTSLELKKVCIDIQRDCLPCITRFEKETGFRWGTYNIVETITKSFCYLYIYTSRLVLQGRERTSQSWYRRGQDSGVVWQPLHRCPHTATHRPSTTAGTALLQGWGYETMKSTKVQPLSELRMRGTANWWAGLFMRLLVVSR